MRVVYVDPFAGVSGDMLLGALVDAGWSFEALEALARRLDLPGVKLRRRTVLRNGLRGTLVEVVSPESGSAAPHHAHRGLGDLLALIARAGLPEATASRAEQVLRRLAEVEAQIHSTTVDAVHFHEVGAVDTLVDVVGTLAGFAALGAERIVAGSLPVGRGAIQTAHGRLPVPPPAVAALTVGLPTHGVDIEGELVTPTGAALLATLVDAWGVQPPMIVERVGYGAGQREFPVANLLRLFVGQAADSGPDTVVLLETNIDDMNPELYEHVAARRFALGALDVWTTPIGMKRGRPAVQLSVLAPPDRAEALLDTIFAETTTFGVRRQEVRRDRLERRSVEVETAHGRVTVKLGLRRGRAITASPEYASCRAVAERTGVPLRRVYAEAQAAAADLLSRPPAAEHAPAEATRPRATPGDAITSPGAGDRALDVPGGERGADA